MRKIFFVIFLILNFFYPDSVFSSELEKNQNLSPKSMFVGTSDDHSAKIEIFNKSPGLARTLFAQLTDVVFSAFRKTAAIIVLAAVVFLNSCTNSDSSQTAIRDSVAVAKGNAVEVLEETYKGFVALYNDSLSPAPNALKMTLDELKAKKDFSFSLDSTQIKLIKNFMDRTQINYSSDAEKLEFMRFILELCLNHKEYNNQSIIKILELYEQYQREKPTPLYTNLAGECIEILNYTLSGLFKIDRMDFVNKMYLSRLEDPTYQRLVQTVDSTIRKLDKKGLVSAYESISTIYNSDLSNPSEKVKGLKEDALEVMQRMVNNKPGIYFYVVSAASGFHTLSVILDNTDPKHPIIIYLDTNQMEIMSADKFQEYLLEEVRIYESNYPLTDKNGNPMIYGLKTNIALIKLDVNKAKEKFSVSKCNSAA